MRLFLPCAIGLAVLTTGRFGLAAQSESPKPTQATPAPASPLPPPPKLGVKIFRLDRAEPPMVIVALEGLLGDQCQMLREPPPPSGLGATGIPPRPPGTVVVWKAAAAPSSRVLVVRGTDRHLRLVAEIVRILDRPAGGRPTDAGEVQAFRLTHAAAEDVNFFIGVTGVRRSGDARD